MSKILNCSGQLVFHFATQKHFFVIKNLEILSPTSEKSSVPLIPLDTYFAEHPNEGHLTLTKKSEGDSPAPATPSIPQATTASVQPFQAQVKQPVPANTAASARGPAPRTLSIELISPYQNNWTIKARVSYKGDLRTWSNSKGEGKVFLSISWTNPMKSKLRLSMKQLKERTDL